MNIETFSETKKVATEKWREYNQAVKKTSDPLYKELKSVYNQMKAGKKVIDIFKVIQKGGVHENFHPKLAIAKATSKKVICRYFQNGTVYFLNKDEWSSKVYAADVDLKNCLPVISHFKSFESHRLTAPVPIIPAKHLPDKLTDDYYILWEVDEWKMVPPTDPWLLRRITRTLFVVLAGWDLTPLEKAVMAGRMH